MFYRLHFLKKNLKTKVGNFTDSTIMIRGKVKLQEVNSTPTKQIEIFSIISMTIWQDVVITQSFKHVCNVQQWKKFKGKLLLSGSATKCLKKVSKGPGKNLSKRNHSVPWLGSEAFCPIAHFIKLILLK